MRVDSDTTSDSSATAATATGSRFLRDGGSSGTPTIGAMGVKLNQFKSSLGSLLTRSSSTLRVPDHALNQHQSIHNNNNAPQSQTVSKTMCAEPLVSPGVFGIVGDKGQPAAPSMPLSTAPIRPRMAMAQALFVDTKRDNEGPLDRELPPLPSTAVQTSRGGALRQNTAAATGIPRPLPPSSSSSSSNAPYARSAVPRVARLASAPSVQRSNTVGATSSRRIVPPSRSHQQRQPSESEAESAAAAQLVGPSVVADPRGAAPMDYSSSTDTDEDSGIAATTASMMASGGLVAAAANKAVDVREEEEKEGGLPASGSSAMAVPARPTANGAVGSMESGHPPAETAADSVSEDYDGSAVSSDVSMAEAPSIVDSIAMDDQQQQQQGSGLVDSSNAKDLDNAFGSSVGKDTVDSSSSSAAALGSLGIQSMANISPRLSLRLSSDASTFGFGLSALASLISSDDASAAAAAAEAVEEEAAAEEKVVVAPAGSGESKDAEAAAARVSDEVDSDRMSLDVIEDTQQQSEPRGSVPAKEEETAAKEPSVADKAREEEDMENPIHARLRSLRSRRLQQQQQEKEKAVAGGGASAEAASKGQESTKKKPEPTAASGGAAGKKKPL
ncbi:hypothetical protein EV177_009434, partial [Coemansia sp. RSA 1804]